MMPSPALARSSPPELLRRLESLCGDNSQESLRERMADLAALAAPDMARFEVDIAQLKSAERAVQRGAKHLLDLGGKRLRPMCVALAAHCGRGFDERALALAVSVELVHAATLLHDDVVDVGETRRGAQTARVIFGNAVSIFAGDWLLIDALRRVRHAAVDGALERLLDAIEEMIVAESKQLERRGRLDTSEAEWLEVIEGKTAALFRWAMYAGGRAGGLEHTQCAALDRYGLHLGVAFQAIDDLLDLAGDPRATGKALFTDLREGKLTYPIIVARSREPALGPILERIVGAEEASPSDCAQVRAILEHTGSIASCRALAMDRSALAKEALRELPPSRARLALETVADAVVFRPV